MARVIGLLFAIYRSEVKHRLFAFILLALNAKCSGRRYHPVLALLTLLQSGRVERRANTFTFAHELP